MDIAQSMNVERNTSLKLCHRDFSNWQSAEGLTAEKLERRLVERLPFARPDTELACAITASGTDAMLDVLFQADLWKHSIASRLKSDESALLVGRTYLWTLPVHRLERLTDLGLDLSEYSDRLQNRALQTSDPDCLSFVLEQYGWSGFHGWSQFSNLIRRCTPTLAPVLAAWLETYPDPSPSPARRAFGEMGSLLVLTEENMRGILYAHHVASEELFALNPIIRKQGDASAVLLERLKSNHGKIALMARFPTLGAILGASSKDIKAALA